MPAIFDTPIDLLAAATALDSERFEQFVGELLRVRAGRLARKSDVRESSLLERVNAGPSRELWAEYRGLREKHRCRVLTSAEHDELVRISDIIEEFQADRAAALAELANIRGLPLSEMMIAMGITGPTEAGLHPQTN